MQPSDNADQYMALAKRFVAQLRSQVNSLALIRRRASRYPFDHLCLEFLSKVIALDEACFALLSSGWVPEAYGLARSIVECALTLRYITSDLNQLTQRTMKFVSTSKADRQLWLYLASKSLQDSREIELLERDAIGRKITPDPKAAFDPWSGERNFVRSTSEMVHPLDPVDADAEYKKMRRTSDYYYTSHFVHCSQTAMDFSNVLDGDMFILPSTSTHEVPFIEERCITLLISYTKQVTSYALYGMNVAVPASFTVLTDFLFDEQSNRFIDDRETTQL
jgi:hypothetical protein